MEVLEKEEQSTKTVGYFMDGKAGAVCQSETLKRQTW